MPPKGVMMFISDKIIFLQLDKTASTHIAKLINSVSPGTVLAKHSQLEGSAGDRCVIGSVRNPWDWYVSLWAYGCDSKGKIYKQLKRPFPKVCYRLFKQSALQPRDWGDAIRKAFNHSKKDHAYWKNLYSCVDDPILFRKWLLAILSKDGKELLIGQYPHLPLREFAGLLTFRFLFLFVEARTWRQMATKIESQSELLALYRDHGIVDRFIRMEQLEHDLSSILKDLKIDFNQSDFILKNKTNTSKHHDTSFYYDNETVDLVTEHDKLMISEFKYKAPVLV
jgi:hypothetical protein